MKNKKASKKKCEDDDKKNNPCIDLLRGRVPVMVNKWWQLLFLLIIAVFWLLVIWRTSVWSISVPGLGNLIGFFKRGHSP